jgi:thiamine-monophosphate kinase
LKTNNKTISDLGEFGLIKHLTESFVPSQESTKKGIGDDAAVLDFQNENVVISTDLLIEGIHFNLAYMPLKHLGYKAVVVNLSDIYAMNAVATQITVSIAISNRFTLEAMEELYAGIALACKKYKVDLVGGDTTSSTKGLIISVTAIGKAKKEKLVYRNGANKNDLLLVSGDLGGAYFGLQVLERENLVFKSNPNLQPDLADYDYVIERQLKPEARKDIIELLEKLEIIPTSMIDISDGLSSEILHLSEQSGRGFTVFEEKIPLDPQIIRTAEEFGINPITAALNGGEDYELLFTISLSDFDKIKGNPNFSIIGKAEQEGSGNYLQTKDTQSLIPMNAQGWNSLLKNE